MQASNIVVFILTAVFFAIAIRNTSLIWNNEHRVFDNNSLFLTADLEKAIAFFILIGLSLIPAMQAAMFGAAFCMGTIPFISRQLRW